MDLPESREAPRTARETRFRHWVAILIRTAIRAYEDGITTIASGIAFFVVLAIFPGIAAVVALYGIFAGPKLGQTLLNALPQVLPDYAIELVARQIRHLTSDSAADAKRLGITSALGFGFLLVSANRGSISLFRGLNTVYRRSEGRGFLAFIAVSLAFTCCTVAFLAFAVGAVVLFPGMLRALGLDEAVADVIDLLRWPVVLTVVGIALAVVYRFGPSRRRPDWRCIALGSSAASLLWVCGSLLFSFVVGQLGRFDELYGSVGIMIGFMLWIWLSVTVVLIGAELDAVASDARTAAGRPRRAMAAGSQRG